MEKNTFATSVYIDAPVPDVATFLADGMNLNAYTLFSRMREQIDESTWLGTASGYQAGLYYHSRRRAVGAVEIVEWHCGAKYREYHHVYPMLLFRPEYFGAAPHERGTYYHWISFVDPDRCTPMIPEGMPPVHRAEAESLKAQLERRAGHRRPVRASLELRSHTIYVDVPIDLALSYFGATETVTEWGFMLRRDGSGLVDEYDRPVELEVTARDLGGYHLVELDTTYVETGAVVRTPIVLVPASYAFGRDDARGVIMHRVSAWPAQGERDLGKSSPDAYDAEAINAKRILEARAGNLESYGKGCSYPGAGER